MKLVYYNKGVITYQPNNSKQIEYCKSNKLDQYWDTSLVMSLNFVYFTLLLAGCPATSRETCHNQRVCSSFQMAITG